MTTKVHAQHPTQHAACGAPSFVAVVSDDRFDAMGDDRRCKRCAKVRAAMKAGRPVFRGYEDPETGECGAQIYPSNEASK